MPGVELPAQSSSTGQAEHARVPLLNSDKGKSFSLFQSAAAYALDSVESLLNYASGTHAEPLWLSGNFAPVAEPEGGVYKDLEVKGTLPACVNGEFMRIGPNPKYRPVSGYHWFDGDGMLHAVRIKDGAASYVNRYVQTSRLQQENAYGRAVFMKLGDMKGFTGLGRILLGQARGKLGITDSSNGAGTANTALVFHGGELLALHEGDAPYVVRVLRDGELETLGRETFGGALDHSFTAHPKVDPVTGEMFTFCYQMDKAPHVVYRVISREGQMGPHIPVTIPQPVMMHDFAVTESHAVFMDLNLVFDPKAMIKRNSLPFVWDDSRPARFGVMPRYDTTEANIRWFERPPNQIFHNANAWDDEDEVVLFGCRFSRMDLDIEDNAPSSAQMLTEFRFDMKSGASSEKTLSMLRTDFPRINENFTGRKQRYVYAAVFDGTVDIVGVVKYDLTQEPKLGAVPEQGDAAREAAELASQPGGCEVGFFGFGEGRFGSEPVFVPRNPGADPTTEDDGYIMNFVFDNATFRSEVVVIDAKTMSLEPVAVIKLPCRVPFGFHGTFVSEEQLAQQR